MSNRIQVIEVGGVGPAGPQGPQGDTGPTGATGPMGPAGPVSAVADTASVNLTLAGNTISAEVINDLAIRLPATQTTALTTNTAINSSGVSIGANQTWKFDAFFITFVSGSNLGMKFAAHLSGAASIMAAVTGTTSSATTIELDKMTTQGTNTAKVFGAFGTVNGWVRIEGTFVSGATPQTFYLSYASNNAACTAFLEVGSYMTAKRIS